MSQSMLRLTRAGLLLSAIAILLVTLAAKSGTELRPDKDVARRQFVEKLVVAKGDPARLEAMLDSEILAFQPLIEESMVFRQKLAVFAAGLHAKIAADQPLSGDDLDRLNKGFQDGMVLTRRIFAVVDVHANWRIVSPKELEKLGIRDLPVPLRTKGTMLSLAGSLFLYDSYRLNVAVITDNKKARRVLNRGDKGYFNSQKQLDKVTEDFLDITSRMRVGDELSYCEENQFATAAYYGGAPTLRYLQELIAQSSSRSLLRPNLLTSADSVIEHAHKRSGMVADDLRLFGDNSMNTLSLFFGNTVGMVETRKGKLWDDALVATQVKAALQPGDILLEKTPFRLTDTFIPGHWGHAAIWVGTEAELKTLGIWDDPMVKPYQENIRAGKCIVEALRSGVTMNTVEHFLNIDDLAVIHAPALSIEQRRHHILLALRQVGKEYDFNFDVEAADKIVCSELVYVVYTDIVWPTSQTLGRYTISPDNVAAKAFPGGPLRLVLFWHDGRLVRQKPLETMAELMEKEKPDVIPVPVPWLPDISVPKFEIPSYLKVI
jgi:uncharacterized protein YycO